MMTTTRLSRYCEGVMEAAWLAALILTPLFFNIYSSRIFEPDKIALLRSLALVCLGAWVIKIVDAGLKLGEGNDVGRPWWKRIVGVPLAGVAFALLVVYIVSTVFSVTPRVSFWGSYQRLQGTYTTVCYLVFFATMLANLRRRTQVDRLITTAIVVSLPISLYGVLQRYKIDPIPWSGDVSKRIASNLGNSIFVAAYLIMVFPLVVARALEAMRALLREDERLPMHVTRATLYIFTAIMHILAIYFSGSRGPALGWLLGVFVLCVLFSWHWQKRWLTASLLGLGFLAAGFIVVFNIPKGPLEALRSSPAVGRFGSLLDADSNSAKVRQYIWEGTVDLVSLHPPLKFPDGSQDRFNLLRPLIGYGPESMYVAFNPFYIPQLGQIEKRNASPDRAHNETWDAMVITGVLGLVVYLALFISVFYYGAKWLGLIVSQAQTRLFLGTCLVGMLLLSTGLAVWRGVEYIGLGIPLGIVGGVILYIGYSTLVNRYPASVKEGQEARVVTLIGLSVALFVHFIEINFGIAIASTRLYFWVYAALLVLVGYILPGLGVYGEAVSQPDEEKNEQSTEDKPVASGKARRMKRSEKALMPVGYSLPLWLRDVLPSATIVALILVTLGYDLVANLSQSSSLGAILVNSLTRLPNRNNAYSNGILALILTAWLASVFLVASENRRLRIVKDWLRMLLLMMAFSSIIGLVFWFWHIESLVTIAKPTVQSGLDAFDQVTRVNSLLPHYYFYVIGLLLLCGIFFQQWKPVRKSRTGLTSILVLLIVALVSFWGVYKTNVQVIQADMVFKMADQFNQPGRYQVARLLYKRSNSLAPDEDYYYLFLGRNYLEEAKTVSDPTQQAELVKAAEEDLKLAQRINPLNTDHTANLGRLYSWWAAISDDPLIRQQRGEIASNYYTMATTLSPNNSTLWGEWALLYLEIFQQPDEALTRLEHALSLDPRFNWTQGLMGDYYVRVGRSLTDTVKRREAFEIALQHYRDALALSKSSENLAKIGYLLASANADIELGNLGEAITAYQDALALNPRETDVWRIEETLAHVYLQAGDKDSALYYGNLSLNAAPADQKSRLQDFLDQIMAGP